MGRYNQLLIEFMMHKGLRMEEIIDIKKETYFNPRGPEGNRRLEDDEAKEIWLQIKEKTSIPAHPRACAVRYALLP